ncbi:MerR family transcriptional regulator [Streptomyces sp. NRRL F-5135]|uniref:MerR family transcriptional regulator n=1 Tax=Streptomyces sp. NRRL F-5135 TaxID=1463858 RepID=UPI003B63FD2B
MPPRQVKIGDAAAFAGSTPRAIRHYHEIGLLPEPERGGDDRRRYGYEDMIRLLWIRKMAEAGIALGDIRDAFTTGMASVGGDSGDGIAGTLERLEETLAEQEAGREAGSMSAFEAIGKMPYDFSPARLRCMELAEELSAQDSPAT